MSDGNWRLEGIVNGRKVREPMPDKVFDQHDTRAYAVFSDGGELLLVPLGKVEP